jgi:hypothetical protein
MSRPKSPEERILGRFFQEDDPSWLYAYVYAHDALADDPNQIATLLTESNFGLWDLARALCHAVQEKGANSDQVSSS